MAKWKSPLFSDIRNKIGESVVFSQWKGRPYFRSYVTPANPQTNNQQAHRNQLAQVVDQWQAEVTTEPQSTAWDEEALDKQISGFNLMTQACRMSDVDATAGGVAGEVDVIYNLNFDPGNVAMYVYDVTAAAWSIEIADGNLSSGDGNTVTLTGLTTGNDVEVWLAYAPVLVDGDIAPLAYQAFNNWHVDTTNGTAPDQQVTVP